MVLLVIFWEIFLQITSVVFFIASLHAEIILFRTSFSLFHHVQFSFVIHFLQISGVCFSAVITLFIFAVLHGYTSERITGTTVNNGYIKRETETKT